MEIMRGINNEMNGFLSKSDDIWYLVLVGYRENPNTIAGMPVENHIKALSSVHDVTLNLIKFRHSLHMNT